ncbi:MAG: flavin reductase family protein [Candidatus Marinimicrobia bacterium]|jgi:flavin reductase (DIM6/NTAB) family NADH-FMN oxidoreductase RutF|nr:flavin reductase family protein [Candidatus Neomarinimicrobiota bacterium]MBT3632502.1 flavin reductase family protein [Candidatus Neomarinimicrobiota bacterium]MBT3824901.1 flavin reductase family protein [Candidatus Neomarinimicrobiota bacterium]MBT4132770.1 flavin reductase family protein [Candidatus Neomarinimicrobiota bacterium]MBT4295308.1 flavin reductase family protein [Candidatus Neomarinimicrobiota bacterium]
MTFNLEAKKHTLRLLHHNVAIVSSGQGVNTVGATVTWFTQSSFEPPYIAMAVKADSRLYAAIKSNKNLIVSLVSKDDKSLAGAFFKPGSWDGETFGGFPAKAHELGGAILESSPAWLACEVRNIVEEGDHHVIISQVVDSGIHNEEEQAMCLSETGWHYGG